MVVSFMGVRPFLSSWSFSQWPHRGADLIGRSSPPGGIELEDLECDGFGPVRVAVQALADRPGELEAGARVR
jgi:hypothetical protein